MRGASGFTHIWRCVRNVGGVPEAIGGVADHVHLLIGLRATHTLADVVRDAKAVSSRWAHEEIRIASFAWLEGYGAFTVSPSQRRMVSEYIATQEKHHQTRTFQEEYLELLKRSGVEYDERYLWLLLPRPLPGRVSFFWRCSGG